MALKSRFEWLKQEQAKERRDDKRTLQELRRSLAVLGSNAQPIGGSQYMGNTGLGEDGKLQPSMPTNMVNTASGPTMLHEGEDLNMKPNGDVQVIPADQPMSQLHLAMLEQKTGMPGMRRGGIFTPSTTGTTDPNATSSTKYSGRGNIADRITMPDEAIGLGSPIGRKPTSVAPSSTPTTATIDTSNMFQAVYQPATQATTTGGGTNPPYNPETDDSLFSTPDAQLSPEQLARRNWLLSSGAVGGYMDPNQFSSTYIGVNQATDTNTNTNDNPLTPNRQTDPNIDRWNRSLSRLEQIASGNDPFAAQIRAQEMQRLSAEEQAQRGALEQQMSQAGVTGLGAATERAMLGSQLGAQQQQLAGDLRQQEYAAMMQAANALPSASNALAQFNYRRDTDAIGAMIEAGDFTGAASQFQNTYGVPLDTSRLQTEQGRADFASGMANVTRYIASGMSWDDALVAMQSDGTLEMLGMDPASARLMYERMALSTDPVYRAMNAVSDDTLAALFPDMDPAKARSTFGRLHLLGIVTVGADGEFQVDYDLLGDLFPDAAGSPLGGGATPPTPTEQEGWDAFADTLPTGTEGQWTYARWVQEGRPSTFDAFQKDTTTGYDTNFVDLYTTTNGVLPPNSTQQTLNDVAAAQSAGDTTVINQFGVPDPAMRVTFLGASNATSIDRSGHYYVHSPYSNAEIAAMKGKVVTISGQDQAYNLLARQLNRPPTQQEVTTFMADHPEIGDIPTESWYIKAVEPDTTGSGGMLVTMVDVNTGTEKTTVIIPED